MNNASKGLATKQDKSKARLEYFIAQADVQVESGFDLSKVYCDHYCLNGECSHETMSIFSKNRFQNMLQIDHTPKDRIFDWLQHHTEFRGTVAF